MRNPRSFAKPLAQGAPDPLLEIPVRPARMIHFFDPSNERIVAKLPELATRADILLGNLEDAIPADRKGPRATGSRGSAASSTSAGRRCGRGSTRSTRPGCSTT